jgi:formate-dependent nitrite reductase cytochrome c552 subunit
MLMGVNGYELGMALDGAHAHSNIENTCITCHMAEPFGFLAGGHQMKIYAEEEEHYNFAGCTACHSDAAALEEDMLAFQDEMDTLMVQLWDLLVAEGIANPSNGLAKTGTYPTELAGCYFNYKFVQEDLSRGVHNPTYAKALVENSIAALQAK